MGLSLKANKASAASNRVDYSELVVRAQGGDRGAYGSLIELTQGRLLRFCLTLTGNRATSEDLCQEAYIKVFGKLKSLENPNAFLDWLFQITKNLHLDLVRSPVSREIELDEQSLDLSGGESKDMVEIMTIHAALSQFEPEDRWLLLLIDLEERSYREAGEILGISEDAVRSRVFRIRQLFLQKWREAETISGAKPSSK